MNSNPRSLLIMSCSQHKRLGDELLPALERYDGPPFRLLRRFLKDQPSKWLDIYIISAKFGLISSAQPIPYYDQRITPLGVQELQPQVLAKLQHILSRQSYQGLCLCMGKDYLQAMAGYDKVLPPEIAITNIAGSPGKKLAELHRWLYGGSSRQKRFSQAGLSIGGTHLHGVEINITSAQVLEVARRALAEGQGNPLNYYSWYVQVDEKRVAPKWLVRQLCKLPLSSFTTDDACRMLTRLGVEVRHT